MSEQFITAATDLIIRIAVMALTGLALLAFKEAREYIKAKMGGDKFKMFQDQLELAIRALEQVGIIQKWDGAQKKQQATVMAHQIADALKLSLTDDQIDMMIEAMVQVLNSEAGKFEASPQFRPYTTTGSAFVEPTVGS